MGLDLDYSYGQTPLEEDEKEGLLIPGITTREELDELEQLNIQKAVGKYLFGRKLKLKDILTEQFIFKLHRDMLGEVWDWAGTTRKSNKNIGVDKLQVAIRLRQLLENCKFWIENGEFNSDEIAIRFKHELVFIHVFPNGNGRHSRIMADILIKHCFEKEMFTWGANSLTKKSEKRNLYIQSLRKADKGNFGELLKFARS
jgi:Fic-DOC domain mobile mystery protein B